MAIIKPDYKGNTIVNLIHSIYERFGLSNRPNETMGLRILNDCQDQLENRIILIIIDGAGESFYRYYKKVLGLDKWYRGCIHSVYPSTTASSITSILTGLTPLEHGIPGWHTYFKDTSSVINILPFRQRFCLNNSKIGNSIPDHYIHFSDEARELTKQMLSLQPNYLSETIYSKHVSNHAIRQSYRDYREFSDVLESFMKGDSGRAFAYAYIPSIDTLSHKYGQHSTQVVVEAEVIGKTIRKLLKIAELNNTSIIVTADHGFVSNSKRRTVATQQHPDFQRMLALPLCGEPRTAFAYINAKDKDNFLDYVKTFLSDKITIKHPQKMINEGWFGIGNPHPDFINRLGDFVLCMNDNYSIFDTVKNESLPELKGVHGGWHPNEIEIPIFMTRF